MLVNLIIGGSRSAKYDATVRIDDSIVAIITAKAGTDERPAVIAFSLL